MEAKASDQALGPSGLGPRYFAGGDGGRRGGWPVVAPGVAVPRGSDSLVELRRAGEIDTMARRAWDYRNGESYGLNSYGKPALVLQTLEGLLGEETMVKVLRTYARRYRFAHPTTADFVATVNEVTGRDWRWFFDQTFFSSDLCDYAVEVKSERARAPAGWFEKHGKLELKQRPKDDRRHGGQGTFESEVTVVRNGDVLMPVELRVDFADGRTVDERWDGRDRWKRFDYQGSEVVRTVVDPAHKIAIDVRPSNNEWISDERPAARAATKWAARYLLWLQDLLEMHAVVG
jgi:hypothetical protein